MSNYTLYQGDCIEYMQKMNAGSVQTCVTSPPYYGLRDYGVVGQIGLEPTPEAYVEKLVQVFREVRRVLKDDGTLWLNLGDSYWGGKGQSAHGGSDKQRARFERNESINRDYQEIGRHGWTAPKDGKHEFIKPKDLIGIPWMVAFALRADGWYLRSDIVWHKPNPMPESVKDRPTKAHEYIFLMTKSPKYYYDAQAILEQANYDGRKDTKFKGATKSYDGVMPGGKPQTFAQNGHERWVYKMPDGSPARNKRSVWEVTTKPYKEAHFATYPPDLIRPCILAGSKEGDTVLDPFNGSGTTGEVSIKNNRNYIGIDLNNEYVAIAEARIKQAQKAHQPTLLMAGE